MEFLSVQEAKKLAVLEQLCAGQITNQQAREHLGIHRETLRRLKNRYLSEGPLGVRHRLRGRPSNRGSDSELRREVISLFESEYKPHDFGAKHFWDLAHADFSSPVSYKTVWRWLRQAEAVKRKRRAPKHRSRRPRKEAFGELVQMDTSIHRWLRNRSAMALVSAIDDASSHVFSARLFERDTTLGNMHVMREIFTRYGLPIGFYVDRSPIFKVTRTGEGRVVRKRFQRATETQVQRALEELGVELSFAYSPQAKGRIERSYGTWQDRLVSELSKAGIDDIDTANDYIAHRFLPDFNHRFAKRAEDFPSAFVPLNNFDIDRVLAEKQQRTVTNDHVIYCKQLGITAKVMPDEFRASYARAQVEVIRHVDRTHSIYFQDRKLKFEQIDD